MNVLLYLRVSTSKQRLAAQEREARAECARRGWTVVDVVRDPAGSAADLSRPALQMTLSRIAAGEAAGLVVTHLDRLTRDVVDMGELLDWLHSAGVRLVALDLDLDTASAGARNVALAWASFAQIERERTSSRTKTGLAKLRARGAATGRPAVADRPELAERIRRMRTVDRLSLRSICRVLDAERVPTLRGATSWRPSAVQSVLGYTRPPRRRARAALPPIPKRGGSTVSAPDALGSSAAA